MSIIAVFGLYLGMFGYEPGNSPSSMRGTRNITAIPITESAQDDWDSFV
jgi:hypothetical protein